MMIPIVKNQEKFKDIQYYIFDEASHLDKPNKTIYEQMQTLFYDPANIEEERMHTLSMNNCKTYEEEIRNAGDIDVTVLGLGFEGHFCSNNPRCTSFDSRIEKY